MIYPIKLFINNTQKLSFSISSEELPYQVLETLDNCLCDCFKAKNNYLSKYTYDLNFIKQELHKIRLLNTKQNNLIICYLINHYINNKQSFDIYLTCNDFKIKSNIKITDFLSSKKVKAN